GVHFFLGGEGAHAEQAVLRLQHHRHALGHVVGHQGRNADVVVDVETVLQFAGHALGHLFMGQCHAVLFSGAQGAFFDAFFEAAADQPVDVDAGGVNLRRVEFTGFDDLLDLDHGDAPGGGDHRVEVLRGVAVDHIAEVVGLPALDDGEVAGDGRLEDVVTAVDLARFLAFGDRGAVAGGGE